jgi:hypothetical protein
MQCSSCNPSGAAKPSIPRRGCSGSILCLLVWMSRFSLASSPGTFGPVLFRSTSRDAATSATQYFERKNVQDQHICLQLSHNRTSVGKLFVFSTRLWFQNFTSISIASAIPIFPFAGSGFRLRIHYFTSIAMQHV